MAADVWAEIDLSAIAHNVARLRRLLGPRTQMMAVVKANAYGHGLLPVARRTLASGADCLGVARLGEAVYLRDAGIAAPILIFGYTPPKMIPELLSNRLIQTVYSYDIARELSEEARRQNASLPVHVKVDTGMGRLGVVACEKDAAPGLSGSVQRAAAEIQAIRDLPGLRVQGVYTHFATADHADKSYAVSQFSLFQELMRSLRGAGPAAITCHAANSAAAMEMPQTHMDMVRTGISVYGLCPSAAVDCRQVGLVPAMTLKARIVYLKKVGAGFSVSYGATEQTGRPTTIATVSIGYADGYNRLFSSSGRMLVRGLPAPVIGRVCMDQTMLDVGHIPGVRVGDEALVFGRGEQGEELSASELADHLGTINYEVVSGVSARVVRRYRGEEG
ncbi:MAG: alanine racemase [Desulfosalsimonadaceae bacterium]